MPTFGKEFDTLLFFPDHLFVVSPIVYDDTDVVEVFVVLLLDMLYYSLLACLLHSSSHSPQRCQSKWGHHQCV